MKKFAVLLSILLMLPILLIPVKSSADTGYSLTVRFESEGTRISNAVFRIYHALDFNGNLIKDFKDYNILVGEFDDNEAMSDLSDTLSAYAALDQIVPTRAGVTNERGEVTFDDLEPGVYLVEGSPKVIGDTIYTCKPCVITVPFTLEDKTELNDVVIQAKFAVRSVSSGTIDYTARKIWENNEGMWKPHDVTVQLLENGKAYGDPVKLNDENGWEYTWKYLAPTSDWKVVEIDIPANYRVLIRLDETVFFVKNTWTGDDSSIEDPPFTTTATETHITETTTTVSTGTNTDVTETTSSETTAPSTSQTTPSSSETNVSETQTTSPKVTTVSTTATTTPTTTVSSSSSGEPKLPQTGQLWWPVPVLLVAGAVLFLAGVLGSDLDEDKNA